MVYLWLMGYGSALWLGRYLAEWVTVPAYTLALLVWLVRTGRGAALGLRAVPGGWDWRLLPLFFLAAYNLLTVRQERLMATDIALLLASALVEELFFRGYLLRRLLPLGRGWACLVSAACFSLLHCLNALGNADLPFLGWQLLSALLAGWCFGLTALRWGSLLPAIAAHCLINLTGSGTLEGHPGYLALYLLGYGIYGLWLYCNRKRENIL